MNDMLQVRNELKAKKPEFLRQDAHKLKRLGGGWRKPKGRHSQMREKRRGHRRQTGIGFSSPKEVRGLTRDGFSQNLVHNVSEVEGKKAIIIGSMVGLKKKMEIVKKANELEIKILNLRNPNEFLTRVQEELQKRKGKTKKEEAKKIEKQNRKEKESEESKEELAEKLKEEKRKVLEGGR